MDKEELVNKIRNWFEKQDGYFEREVDCIDGYYDLEKLAEYILENL